MKLLWTALAFFGAGALACPADDVKDAQVNAPDKTVAATKAPVSTTAPAKAVASKKTQTTKVAADTARKSSL